MKPYTYIEHVFCHQYEELGRRTLRPCCPAVPTAPRSSPGKPCGVNPDVEALPAQHSETELRFGEKQP